MRLTCGDPQNGDVRRASLESPSKVSTAQFLLGGLQAWDPEGVRWQTAKRTRRVFWGLCLRVRIFGLFQGTRAEWTGLNKKRSTNMQPKEGDTPLFRLFEAHIQMNHESKAFHAPYLFGARGMESLGSFPTPWVIPYGAPASHRFSVLGAQGHL